MSIFKLSKFDLSSYFDTKNNYLAELILFGSICYYEELDNLACSKENKSLISIEPDGLIKFASESIQQTILVNPNEPTAQIYFQVVREFGSINDIYLIYSITSDSNSADFYFKNNSNIVKFDKLSYFSSFSIDLNNVHIQENRRFYFYLSNSMSSINELAQINKISKYNYLSEITLLPSNNSEFENVFAFAQNSLIISCVTDKPIINISILLLRLGALKNQSNVSVGVKSSGYGDYLPNWIRSNQNGSNINSAFLIAYPGFEFQIIDTRVDFTDINEHFYNLTLTVIGNFNTDFNYTVNSTYHPRNFYLYLNEPSNGASLIEPSNNQRSFSPYIKIELRKFVFNSSELKHDIVRVGFSNTTLHGNSQNQSIYIMDYNYTYTYTLEWTKLNRRSYFESFFHLKWQANLLDFDEISSLTPDFSIRDILNCTFYNQETLDLCEGIVVCSVLEQNCSFNLFFKTKIPNLQDIYGMKISIQAFDVFHYETETLAVQVRNDSNEAFLYLKTSLFSKVGFSKYSLFSVNDRFRLYAELVVERTGGLNSSLEIIYATRQFPNKHTWFDFNGFKMHPAIAEYDYDEIHSERVIFESGQKVYTNLN